MSSRLHLYNSLTKQTEEFKPINDYKPTGNLIYGKDLFKKLEDKFA